MILSFSVVLNSFGYIAITTSPAVSSCLFTTMKKRDSVSKVNPTLPFSGGPSQNTRQKSTISGNAPTYSTIAKKSSTSASTTTNDTTLHSTSKAASPSVPKSSTKYISSIHDSSFSNHYEPLGDKDNGTQSNDPPLAQTLDPDYEHFSSPDSSDMLHRHRAASIDSTHSQASAFDLQATKIGKMFESTVGDMKNSLSELILLQMKRSDEMIMKQDERMMKQNEMMIKLMMQSNGSYNDRTIGFDSRKTSSLPKYSTQPNLPTSSFKLSPSDDDDDDNDSDHGNTILNSDDDNKNKNTKTSKETVFGINEYYLAAQHKVKYSDMSTRLDNTTLQDDTIVSFERFYTNIILAIKFAFSYQITTLPKFKDLQLNSFDGP